MIFKPTISVENVLAIDKKLLYKLKVKGLILDLDNTLSMHDNPAAEHGVPEWLESMRELGVHMFVASNNNRERVAPLAEQLGLKFIAFSCKPLPFGIDKAVKKLKECGVPRKQIAIVGDQIFTDVLGGNLYGIKSILVEPFYLEDKISFKLRRRAENLVYKRIKV
ncbi:MAG: YqeG family HAD IIIA-type phosphatase [Oscillospiraceae bacterium]|nr:YqeG family HAD IIIA-type phosphatase [Oscillospiraceae bacterium]